MSWSETTIPVADSTHFETLNGLWVGKKEPFVDAGVIRNTNFTSSGVIDFSNIAYLQVEKRQLSKRRLEAGDIILERSGGGPKQPVGRVVFFDREEIPYGVQDVPIFAEHTMVEAEELMTAEWPKRASIRGRGVLAVTCRLGALDFSTGERLDKNNIESRHYHHVFPDALLKEAEIESYLALNCALITDKTNISIGRKDPLKYLKDRYKWTTEGIVNERLQSHLIPIRELSNGGYEGLSDAEKKEKLANDFRAFLSARAKLVCDAAKRLAEGHQLSVGEFYLNG